MFLKFLFLTYFASVYADLKSEQVIPDVLDAAPKGVCEVTYNNGVKVDLGNVLTPTQVKDTPSVKWQANKNSYYTLDMVDPDAPSRKEPKFREWQHWLVVNIPGDHIEKGEILSGYIGAGPPEGSGLHRYVFLVYKQNEKIVFDEKRHSNTSGSNRSGFSSRKFAKKYNLGEPIAANFFQAEWDDYVPILYQRLDG